MCLLFFVLVSQTTIIEPNCLILLNCHKLYCKETQYFKNKKATFQKESSFTSFISKKNYPLLKNSFTWSGAMIDSTNM